MSASGEYGISKMIPVNAKQKEFIFDQTVFGREFVDCDCPRTQSVCLWAPPSLRRGAAPLPPPSGQQANRRTGEDANRRTGKQANRQTGKHANKRTGAQPPSSLGE